MKNNRILLILFILGLITNSFVYGNTINSGEIKNKIKENISYLKELNKIRSEDQSNISDSSYEEKLPLEKDKIIELATMFQELAQDKIYSLDLRSNLYLQSSGLNFFWSKLLWAEGKEQAKINSYQFLRKSVEIFPENVIAVKKFADVLKRLASHSAYHAELEIKNFDDELKLAIGAIDIAEQNGSMDKKLAKRRKLFIRILEENE